MSDFSPISLRTLAAGWLACGAAAAVDVAASQQEAESIALRCTPLVGKMRARMPPEFTLYIDLVSLHPWDEGERYRFSGYTRYDVSTDGRARLDRRTGLFSLRADQGRGRFVEAASCEPLSAE